MNENTKLLIALTFSNTIRVICFTVLAMFFNKWWIILFVIFFMTYQEED